MAQVAAVVHSTCTCGACGLTDGSWCAAPGQTEKAFCPNNSNGKNGHIFRQLGQGGDILKEISDKLDVLASFSEHMGRKVLGSSHTSGRLESKDAGAVIKKAYGLKEKMSQFTNGKIDKDDEQTEGMSEVCGAHIVALTDGVKLVAQNPRFKEPFSPNDGRNLFFVEKIFEDAFDKSKWILLKNPLTSSVYGYVLYRECDKNIVNKENVKKENGLIDLLEKYIHQKPFITNNGVYPFVRAMNYHARNAINFSAGLGRIGNEERKYLLEYINNYQSPHVSDDANESVKPFDPSQIQFRRDKAKNQKNSETKPTPATPNLFG